MRGIVIMASIVRERRGAELLAEPRENISRLAKISPSFAFTLYARCALSLSLSLSWLPSKNTMDQVFQEISALRDEFERVAALLKDRREYRMALERKIEHVNLRHESFLDLELDRTYVTMR